MRQIRNNLIPYLIRYYLFPSPNMPDHATWKELQFIFTVSFLLSDFNSIIPRGKREDDEHEIHSFDTEPLISIILPPKFILSILISIVHRRHGSGADLHSRSGEVFADAHAQSQSCSGVSLPIYCHNLVLYSRCYARQLRSAGFYLISASSRAFRLFACAVAIFYAVYMWVFLMTFECFNIPQN